MPGLLPSPQEFSLGFFKHLKKDVAWLAFWSKEDERHMEETWTQTAAWS